MEYEIELASCMFRYSRSYKFSQYSINVQMIAAQQSKYSKLINSKELQSDLIEKTVKLNISKLGLETAKDVHPAFDNTFILVDVNPHTNTKKVVHATADGVLLGQLLIKEAEYQLFMLSPMYVNILQYTDKKPQASNVQWNLLTHDVISVNLNREILPMLKVFAFTESRTFCVCQFDQHTENMSNIHKQEEPGTYHTKFKLSYYKHPLRKTHQKPNVVFKTHTNPKEYGYHQEIIKLNNHSMVGSISNKMDDNDETCLKTFDFRNVPMGIQINYKFHVQINYRKELLGLWVTDMWEVRPEHFYLKCELRVDKNKEQKFWKTTGKINMEQSLEQCLHLTWAYKSQNTIKFAKFKTPLLNSIQFIDGFKQKQRARTIVQKTVNKQKVIYPSSISSHIIVPAQTNQIMTISSSQPNQIVPQSNTMQIQSNSLRQDSSSQTFNNQSVIQAGQLGPQSTIVLQPKLELLYTPTTYVKSLQTLPVYYINNTTQEIVVIDREFGDWMVSYPAYYPTMAVYFRQAYNIRDNEKILQITFQKKAESTTFKQLQLFLLEEIIDDLDLELGQKVGALLGGGEQRVKEFDQGWYNVDSSKFQRETKSRSNYQSRQYKN